MFTFPVNVVLILTYKVFITHFTIEVRLWCKTCMVSIVCKQKTFTF